MSMFLVMLQVELGMTALFVWIAFTPLWAPRIAFGRTSKDTAGGLPRFRIGDVASLGLILAVADAAAVWHCRQPDFDLPGRDGFAFQMPISATGRWLIGANCVALAIWLLSQRSMQRYGVTRTVSRIVFQLVGFPLAAVGAAALVTVGAMILAIAEQGVPGVMDEDAWPKLLATLVLLLASLACLFVSRWIFHRLPKANTPVD